MSLRPLGTGILCLTLVVMAVSCASSRPDVDVTPTARTNVDAHVGKSLSSEGNAIADITDRFGSSETVFAVVNVPGKIEGTMRVVWMRDTQQVHEQSVTLDDDVHAYSFQLAPASGGHTAGTYRFEVYINGDRAEVENFQVQ